MIERKVENAAREILGSVPSSWNIRQVAERLEQLKPLDSYAPANDEIVQLHRRLNVPPEIKPPPITYFLWLLRTFGISSVYYAGAVMSEDNIKSFESEYRDMSQEAALTAELDVANFVAEQEISPVPEILKRSVLAISALYKYIGAQENSLEFLLTDDAILKAIRELRTNPYLFFSYGEDAVNLMPVKWEDL